DGDGMIHQIRIRVGSPEAIEFWQKRLADNGIESELVNGDLLFTDPEGLGLVLTVDESGDPPLRAEHPEIPAEMALQGFDGARAYASNPEATNSLLEALEFEVKDDGWEARGESRGGLYAYDPPPPEPGLQGAGTVHHIAWASSIEEHEQWREKALSAGAQGTPVIDRFYFKSVYFREPSGVLFEIATIGPGFTVDEPLETLGERLSLPPDYEHLRERVEPLLTPLPNPRELVQR
ncbi:MAG: glyoxalase family protein, partial [Gaiellaceae bacterium]|nr:glyoxalase family protein [Gaiellaceae bacterium]